MPCPSTSVPPPPQPAVPVPAAPPPLTEEEVTKRLEEWTPAGDVADFCKIAHKPEGVHAMGVVQNVNFLMRSWAQYLEEQKDDPAMVKAFTQAFGLCARRCPGQIQPAIGQLIATAKSLDADTCVRLAHMIADLGARAEAYALLSKSANVEGLTIAYYLCLLRLATETMSPPDMALALEVNGKMEAAGILHTPLSLNLMFKGMARMRKPPIAAAIKLAEHRRSLCAQNMIEPCVLENFFNVLDSAVAGDAKLAGEYVKKLPKALVHEPIKAVCAEAPNLNQAGCFVADMTRYVVVDPMTADLSGDLKVPEHTYVVFLYSSIRNLASRGSAVCSANPVNKKLADINRLLASNKQAVVVPYETELLIRGPILHMNPSTPQDRMMLFVHVTAAAQSASFSLSVLSTDPVISKACAEIKVPVVRNLGGTATPPPAPAPSSASSEATVPTAAGLVAPLSVQVGVRAKPTPQFSPSQRR